MSFFRTPQVILFSDDLARAVAFYTRLGFSETFRVPTDGEPIHVDLALDGYKIGIASVASTRDDHGLDPIAEGQRAAVILWTDDTAAAYANVVASGAPALASPHLWLGRLLIAWTADPDGNPIQIVQSLTPLAIRSPPLTRMAVRIDRSVPPRDIE
jgi:catechol 2,3-dioxygenase-like lactoylglutathione lyase family enzyme